MTKSQKLVKKKRHKHVNLSVNVSQPSEKRDRNLSDKMSQTSEKRHKNVNLHEKKSQSTFEKTQNGN